VIRTSVAHYLPDPPPWLKEPFRKLGWAERHLKDLDHVVDAYLGPPAPYLITDKIDANAAEHVLWIKVVKPPPTELSLITGDCVQNIRSSLEYFMQQLTVRTGGVPDRKTQFPIFATASEFKTKGGERMLKQVTEPTARAFVMRNQPYLSGLGHVDPLIYLADLSDGDKHRLLQPLALYCAHLPLPATWRMAAGSSLRLYEGPYLSETVFAHVPFTVADARMEVGVEPEMTVALVQAVMHKDIVNRLAAILGRALGILLDASREFH